MFFGLFLPAVYAQQAETLHFKRIEGLSQSTGYSITKDKQGFLWIATGNGLNRYDGIEMKVYKPSLEPGKGQMQGRVIRSRLLEDEKGQIWFSTDLAVHEFNKREEAFNKHDLITGDKQNETEKFANPIIKLGDHLWLANATDGIFDLNTETKEITSYPLTEKDEKGNLIQLMYHGIYDDNAKFWFATNKGLLSFDLTTKKWQRFLKGGSFYSISYSKDTIYASEGKDVVWFHKTTFHYGNNVFVDNTEFSRGLIRCLYTDVKQNTWMGDEIGNVYCKAAGNMVFRWVGNINGNIKPKSHYPVYCFYADGNTLWAGAYTLGLLKSELDQQQFKSYPQEGSNANEIFVNSIYETSPNEILIGSFENGIMVLDKKNNTATELKLPY
ncbi:MAG TPA: hypothetical protein VL095_14475, partial [Flavisolibacter sp.]|nr:hypothetical protein [Flavisolibacter sp.]